MFRDTFVTASWKLIERITRPASQQNCVEDAMHVINVRLISITEKQYFELTVWSSIGKWKSARKLLRPDPFLIHPHEPNAKSLAVAAVLDTMLLQRAMRCVCHRWHQQGRHIGS